MEIYVNYLAIEVTRRCNMKCNHCLRGDAQNLDISTAVLSGIAKHIHPASVIFTGGEPSLNVPAIKRYFELAERYDTMPAAFYVATNGATSKEQMRDLALTLLESYAKMEEQDMCEVDVSVDMFHEAFRDNDNAKILSGLSFFGQGKQHSVKDDDLNWLLNTGRANKNGIGVVIDPAKESWNPLMDDLVSRNPDGTLEWCGPYAKDKNAANGTGGWPGNNEIATNSTQINYNGSTGMRGKGNVYGSCYTAFANHFWWDDDTDRPYAWLINFSTEGITTSHISMQISVMNTQQSFFSPRFWCAEWSLTDSQAAKDDSQWNLIGEYTIPDVSVWANTLYSSCVAYKSIDFELPQEILGHENVYIRLRPTSDLCSDGSDYANARLNQSASGAALAAEHASSLEYFAIRYNK